MRLFSKVVCRPNRNDIDAFAAGEAFRFGFEILLGIEHDLVGSGVFGELGFLGGGDCADDACSD